MSAITAISAAVLTMTSIELVDFINDERKAKADAAGEPFPSKGFAKLEHKDFLEKVPYVLPQTSAEFSADLPDSYGRPRRGYRFPKREACLMAMSYSYETQAKVFDRMTALEAQAAATAVPQTMAQALRLAAEQAEQLEQQQAALALAAPKAEYVDRYVAANGAKGFRQVAKLLGANEHEFRAWLQDAKIMYRLGGEWTAHQCHIDAGRFVVKTGVAHVNDHAFNATKFTPKGVNWVAGLWGQHQACLAQEGAQQ
ncbi:MULTISPECIES: phage antirepressor KilAC domain-containing protein [unclassified Delftia]|uniref:phage antirepressor KilAC domain-containing protein n=1 Tax=unclassified Delftia TaxID=2613839 RepID=UPI001902A4E7|nr:MULTISPECIES: phage antirepressor KilAC domain-containing protein [unclassified Delftia]MBK0115617.1 phage antirepressor KilAC domain-containing protein [Delftia sp. S65]MBK0119526.1 phage antirepressor KilAC domain-containing protein [Delftia sp. S67]MBK0130170.1 phage antirepressor KilAC domain-containing protein [Delftia sp. S66]